MFPVCFPVKMEELKADIEELKALEAACKRLRVRDILRAKRTDLECDLIEMEEKDADAQNPHLEKSSEMKADKPKKPAYTGPRTLQIRTYAWEQTDKHVKLHVSEGLKNVHESPEENISCSFADHSLRLVVQDLNGSHHELRLTNLFGAVVPEECSFRVRTDRIILTMKKRDKSEWPAVTRADAQSKERKSGLGKKSEPEMDSDDPGAGLMSMMKKMYEEGDDEMKRTIAKAWTESREKQNRGGDL